MKLLLISNSTNAGEAYLSWPRPNITAFLADKGVKRVLFIPYAGVSLSLESLEKSFDAYEAKVAAVYKELGYELYSIHHESDPVKAVENAEAIAVGGGNTFHLFKMMQENGTMDAIRKQVKNGTPFMGWSAGSNVTCPTLCTTNDMPIVEPVSFKGLGLIPFQINPHYLDAHPDGHGGETREQRLEEFMAMNRETTIVGLREATALHIDGNKIELQGSRPMRWFRFGETPKEYEPGSDISFLL